MSIEVGKQEASHRVSYRIHHGEIPPGSDVCHTCDNPPCVNPEHLFVDSRAGNMQDASRKGRLRTTIPPAPDFSQRRSRGEDNWNAKITEDQVRTIRRRYSEGDVSQHQLAEELGVSRGIINHILTGRSWQHVK